MNDELAGRLARNVKQLRQVRGLTQVQMAKLSDLPRATWSNLERGPPTRRCRCCTRWRSRCR